MDVIHWLIVTGILPENEVSMVQMKQRDIEIQQVAEKYGFDTVHSLQLPTTKLDTIPLSVIIEKIGCIFKQVLPEIVYVPFRGDVHTDHRIVFDGVMAATKWFRFNSIKKY